MLILKILRELTVKLMHNRGFTLIELLIVIVIVAILSTIGIVYYGNFLKNSRDAKRQSDLKFIQSALEAYHADNLSYPTDLSPLTAGSKYMTELPTDPKGTSYEYGCIRDCASYCLYTNLEIPTLQSGTDCPNPDYNYRVTKP